MDYSHSFFNMYCINMHCKTSVYNHIKEITMPLTEKTLLARHDCPFCGKTLVSTIEAEIGHLMAEVNSQNKSYLNN